MPKNAHKDFRLTNHPLFETRDLDGSRQIISRLWGPHKSRLVHRDSHFRSRVQAVRLSGVLLSSVEARGVIEVETPADLNKVHVLHMFHKGQLEIGLGGATYICDPDTLALVPAHENVKLRTGEASEACSVAVPTALLESTLSALLNRPILQRISFYPLISRNKPGLNSLLRLVEFLFQECDQPDSMRKSTRLTVRQMEKTLLTYLLELLPHNFSGELLSGARSTDPWHVRYCEEYMKANLDQALSIADLAAAVKTSARTLHEGFRRHRGYSPMEFLRQSRLERVREDMLDPAQDKTVTEGAMKWCFWHLGRFSSLYHRTFGEKPSETVARIREARSSAQPTDGELPTSSSEKQMNSRRFMANKSAKAGGRS